MRPHPSLFELHRISNLKRSTNARTEGQTHPLALFATIRHRSNKVGGAGKEQACLSLSMS